MIRAVLFIDRFIFKDAAEEKLKDAREAAHARLTVSALYPEGVEPWEANLTRFVNFHGKWENRIAEGTPVPTIKEDGTTEKDWKIGAYEGGGYLEKGIYRGWPECMMKALSDFCPICQEAISRYLDYMCVK